MYIALAIFESCFFSWKQIAENKLRRNCAQQKQMRQEELLAQKITADRIVMEMEYELEKMKQRGKV